MMKFFKKQKYLWFALAIIFAVSFFIGYVSAAPTTELFRDIEPEADSTYNLGSSGNEYLHLYVDGCTGCGGAAGLIYGSTYNTDVGTASTTGLGLWSQGDFFASSTARIQGNATFEAELILTDNDAVALGTGLDSRFYYDGTDTFWDLRAVGTGDLMIALQGSFPSPDPDTIHIWSGDAGGVIAASNTTLVIEDNASTGLSILTPDANAGIISFGAPADAQRGGILYNQSAATPADTFIFTIAGADRLNFAQNSFAFQEAFTISTTDTNDLTISAGGQTIFPDDKIVTFGTGQDIAFLNRSTTLNSNTVLTDVFVGTPVTFALAANSLVISNITQSGDIMIAANRGGNSEDYFFADASAGSLDLTAPLGALTLNSLFGAVHVLTDTGAGDDFTVNTNDFLVEGDTSRVGIGTTSPGTILSIGDTGNNTINIDSTATSTFGSGINLRTGCFAVSGTCVGGGGGDFAWTPTTNYGQTANATTTAIWLQATPFSMFASSTAVFVNASTTQFEVVDIFISGDEINDFAGVGLTVSGNALTADLGIAIDTTEITNDTILAIDLSTTTTFLDTELISYVAATDNFTSLTCAEITGSADLCDGSDDGAGGGEANQIATSSAGVISSLLYYTTAGATPELVDPVATTTLLFTSPLSIDNAVSVIGSTGGTVTLDVTGDWTGTLDGIEGASFLRSDAADTATGLLQFQGNASTTMFSVYNSAFFGSTATSSFDSAGVLTLIGNLVFDSQTFDSFTDDATLSNNAGDLRVVDLNCTNCIGATEISDVYLLNNADDSTSGSLTATEFIADDAAATSTFAGGLTIETSGFVYDFSTNNVGVGIANPVFPLSFGTTLGSKIALHDDGASNQTGFGIQNNLFQMFADGNSVDIVFGYGTSDAFTENVRFEGTGNVGIGTVAPASLLHLDSSGTTQLIIERNANTNEGNLFLRTGSTNDWAVGLRDTSDSDFHIFSSGISADAITILRSSGNVGIGTTTPGTLLSVGNTSGINFTVATSTFNSTGGIDLVSGCFAIGGTCVGGGSFTNFILAGDSGSETIDDGNTLTVTGGTSITTAVTATDIVTINVDDVYLFNNANDETSGILTVGGLDLGSLGNRIDLDADNDTSIRSVADDDITFEIFGADRTIWGTSNYRFNDTTLDMDFIIDGDSLTNLFFLNAGTDRVGISSTTPMSLFGVAGTSTVETMNIDDPDHTGTSTMYIYSNDAGTFGGEIILEDSDGAGCTSIYVLNGTITGETVTCPANPVAN